MNQFISETLKGKTYIDPRTDTGFKSLFASKEAIKDFVDGILQLKGDDQIKNLNYSFETYVSVYDSRRAESHFGCFRNYGF